MANCTVSGTFYNPQGAAISGATLRFNIESPVLDGSGNLLVPKELTTTTATDGTWSLSIKQSISGVLTLDLSPNTQSPIVKYAFSLVIPATTTATFQSVWADNPNFAGQSSNLPLSFSDITGVLATNQLPSLTSTYVWVGSGTNLAAGVPITGDVALSNAGVTTVGTVGTSTAANIHNGELLANAATNLNTPSTIVKRDASGNFIATSIDCGAFLTTAPLGLISFNSDVDFTQNATFDGNSTSFNGGTAFFGTVSYGDLQIANSSIDQTDGGLTIASDNGNITASTPSGLFNITSGLAIDGLVSDPGSSGLLASLFTNNTQDLTTNAFNILAFGKNGFYGLPYSLLWDNTSASLKFVRDGGGADFLNIAMGALLMNGALDMNGNLIQNLTDPAAPQDAATKAYVDASAASYTFTSGTQLVGTTVSAAVDGTTIDVSAGNLIVKTNGVGDSQLRQSSGLSVIGRSASTTGNVADIIGTADQVMRVAGAGASAGFGSIDLSKSATVGSSILANANTTATNANTASKIVARDGSGNFSAGTITAALTGTASGNTTISGQTNHGVVLASATNAMSSTTAGTSGQVLTSNGASSNPTFQDLPTTLTRQQIILNSASAYASTNTKIRIWDTIVENTGSDMTYATSATAGMSITINTSGRYAFSYSVNGSGVSTMGLSLNSAQLTTAISGITNANRLACDTLGGADFSAAVAWAGWLTAGDVVRTHDDGSATSTASRTQFTAARIG